MSDTDTCVSDLADQCFTSYSNSISLLLRRPDVNKWCQCPAAWHFSGPHHNNKAIPISIKVTKIAAVDSAHTLQEVLMRAKGRRLGCFYFI